MNRVRIQSTRSRPPLDVTVDPTPFGLPPYVLLEVDTPARELTLWQDEGLLIVVCSAIPRAAHARSAPAGVIHRVASSIVATWMSTVSSTSRIGSSARAAPSHSASSIPPPISPYR